MKKAFDQTVRDIKREVNKKVLKVPGIEQKVLDATSNEPWGPHGSHLADIAQATRNSFEYQLIMSIIWKRLNDTGKNWRHVYKALTVLEYLVAHGSERVIDEIREHAYQISTLSDFQYIDSKGRDQGNNVRRKSQSLVALVNDKERIQEVREKASANRDKYRSTFTTGRPGSHSGYGDRYDEDRYGSRYDDRNGSGRDRDGGYGDEDRYGRDKDRYGRDFDEHYRRDGYRDDDYRGRSRDDSYKYGVRSRSADRERDHSFDDEDRYSSRSGGGRLDDPPQDGRPLERKFSEPNFHAPPSYEEAVKDASSHVPDQKDGRPPAAPVNVPKPVAPIEPKVSSHSESTNASSASVQPPVSSHDQEADAFDEFDPRGPSQAASNAAEVDLFGPLSAEESINHLALVPVSSESSFLESDMPTESGPASGFVASSSASSLFNKPNENPFEDAPFRATQGGFGSQPQDNIASVSPFQTSFGSLGNSPQPPAAQSIGSGLGLDLEESLRGVTYAPSVPVDQTSSVTLSFTSQPAAALQSNGGGFEGLFSQSGQPNEFPPQVTPPAAPARTHTAPPGFLAQSSLTAPVVPYAQTNYYGQPAVAPVNHHAATGLISNTTSGSLLQPGLSLQTAHSSIGTAFSSQVAPSTSASTAKPSLAKDKFETKSGVWADTINRGLVNLNISGPKTNPLADIGVDFDAINRKEQREKKATATTVSTVGMGKAMGSGSGVGRANATSLVPPPNPMMGSGIGMAGNLGMGMGTAGGGMGMGGYAGSMNQPGGMGIGMNMGVGMNNMGMRPNMTMPPGPGIGYNPMGMGGFGSQPYGGGYR